MSGVRIRSDPRVFQKGEDVGRYGGCVAVSRGLIEEFGLERIRHTAPAEAAFVGAGIGAALGGMQPIVEIMTVNFSLLALDRIMNTVPTLLHMSGGQFNVPLIIRMAIGSPPDRNRCAEKNWFRTKARRIAQPPAAGELSFGDSDR